MEKSQTFSVVCYQTAFGAGVVRNVIKSHLSEDEAQALSNKLNPHLESEDWAIEPDDRDENESSQATHA